MKNLLFFSFLMLLTGCTLLLPGGYLIPQQEPRLTAEQEGFNQALDLLTTTHSSSGLRGFQQLYPDSPWGLRAATIVLYVEEVNQRKLQLGELHDEQLRLQSENQQLTEKIEQLKKLLIELEQRTQ